jgi:hypothetical protein
MWPTQLPAEYLVTPPNLRVGAPGSSTSAPAQRQQLSSPNAHVLPQWASVVAGSRSRYRRPRPVAARQTSLLTSHPRHQDGQKTHRARSWPCAPSPRPGPFCSRPAWSRRHRFPRRHKAGTATAHTPVVAAPPSPAGSHPCYAGTQPAAVTDAATRAHAEPVPVVHGLPDQRLRRLGGLVHTKPAPASSVRFSSYAMSDLPYMENPHGQRHGVRRERELQLLVRPLSRAAEGSRYADGRGRCHYGEHRSPRWSAR